MVNSEIKGIAKWARSQRWTVEDDASGHTRFYNPDGEYVTDYPATPSRPQRRMAELRVELRKAGLQIPPPSKKEQRSQHRREQADE